MKIKKSELRRVIREALGEEASEATTSAAGKKVETLMDSSAMNALKAALDKANNKESVKETLNQIFSELGENGQKYLKIALKELAQEI